MNKRARQSQTSTRQGWALSRRAATGAGTALAPLLVGLTANGLLTSEEANTAFSRLLASPDYSRAPAAVRAFVAIRQAQFKGRETHGTRQAVAVLRQAMAVPDIAADALAVGVSSIELVDYDRGRRLSPESVELLRSVGEDGRLSATHPLHVAALVRLASAEVQAGRLEVARSTYE